ncbi:C13 family peptidase [Phenylobacterium sp. SCN 70-31]|uniref:C13 family peptidase n=1 Tax=Phenylobacterium sp. SCN 70-31 TaxID=1660129 RepID=UPI00086F4FB5|nr:C13 family peptidase [Phenylobacterium sp. SCN 70-31]ODT87658.1 MAG: peptidase C13 [Phenylobacterium sp. SCN 70-31]
MARLLSLFAGLWLAAAGGAPVFAAPAFADWAAVVVAGDWHAADGGPTEGFDNARRDVTLALGQAGFQAGNIRQFSVRPERYSDTRPEKSDVRAIYNALVEGVGRARSGCLFYLTSHGLPQGAQVDQGILRPAMLASMLDQTCGDRPTVVVISACFSGVYVPALAKPNRMVLTAARPDRTSFGCGQDNKYPFFDDCFLSSMPNTRDFSGLAGAVKECVRMREAAEKMTPPSEPQIWVGPQLRPMLPLYAFEKGLRPD